MLIFVYILLWKDTSLHRPNHVFLSGTISRTLAPCSSDVASHSRVCLVSLSVPFAWLPAPLPGSPGLLALITLYQAD